MNIRNFAQAALLAGSLLSLSGGVAALDIKDGNAIVAPEKGDRYSIDGVIFGKVELYGYIGGLRDDDGITGIVLKRGATDAQRQVIGSIARTLGIQAFEQDGRELKPLEAAAE